MKVLYIGYYNEGSTARMRGEYLTELLPGATFKIINVDVPLAGTGKIFRSIGWRFKIGPLIRNFNDYILTQLNNNYSYDLVWIDKGVFIRPAIIRLLKRHSVKLVHFTPDPAFTYHRSGLFYEALPLYDYCITTKTFEIANYQQYGVNTIFCTQGYDPLLHKPYHDFSGKRGVVFIGHHEDEREVVLSRLVENNIPVTLAGIKWERFVKRYRNNIHLVYKGKGLFGADYAKTLSAAQIGLGLLSKWIPEKHTTRTFEIPACGTALITERNSDTSSFFDEDEALFYSNYEEVTDIIKTHINDPVRLRNITENGYQKVRSGGFDYKNILKKIITAINE